MPPFLERLLANHTLRARFEQIALAAFLVIVIVACIIGFTSKDLADRVVQLTGSIRSFLEILLGAITVSMSRGAHDAWVGAKVNRDDKTLAAGQPPA